MRVTIATWVPNRTGGIGRYTSLVLKELASQGHAVSVWAGERPKGEESLALEHPESFWVEAELGLPGIVSRVSAWKPDVIFSQGYDDAAATLAMARIAPIAYFTHSYWGTCISGEKTLRFAGVRPCHRRFGRACLLAYFPFRCGGLDPIAMVKNYRRQSLRLARLRLSDAIVASSRHMKEEYVRHGFPEDRIHVANIGVLPEIRPLPVRPRTPSRRLLFLGQMIRAKGGDLLIKAAADTQAALQKPLEIVFCGDGPERLRWESSARRVSTQNPSISFSFLGWVPQSEIVAILDTADLLVVPSVWPEPFGMVGIEAAKRGVPAAAFALGGITDWLFDGVSGALADSAPPTSAGLSKAITRCLESDSVLEALRRGALATSDRFAISTHVKRLVEVFEEIRRE